MAKVTMNIGDELLEKVDGCVKASGMTRTSFFVFAVEQYLAQRKLVNILDSLDLAIKRVAGMGEVDEDVKKELDYFKFLLDGLSHG